MNHRQRSVDLQLTQLYKLIFGLEEHILFSLVLNTLTSVVDLLNLVQIEKLLSIYITDIGMDKAYLSLRFASK